MTLREQLAGVQRPSAPTPYTLLCPPRWTKASPSVLTDDATLQVTYDAFRAAGRADLLLQMRAMVSRLRHAIQSSQVFDAYLPPRLPDGVIPSSLLVSPFVLPTTSTWELALGRMSGKSAAEQAEFAQTPMWRWERAERVADDEAPLVGSTTYYLVPAAEDNSRRGLLFQYTVLTADSRELVAEREGLLALGDLIMATMRWV